MKVVCVHIEHFAAAVEIREHPEFLSHPIIIGGFPNERKSIFECCAQAASLGIVPGMPLRQAHHICPDATFIPLDEGKYTRAFDDVLDILDQFSPIVEADEPGRAFLDVTGLERLLGSEEEIARRIGSDVFHRAHLNPKVGIARNKFVASVAANIASTKRPCVARKGREARYLGPLPARLLPVSEEMRRRLDLLGLRTMGQIASLPLDALAYQFGEEGILAHKLANGEDERPLVPRAKPMILEQELSSESSMETIDALIAALDRILDSLIPRLRNRNQVCGQMKLCFHLDGAKVWHESLKLKEPTDSKREMLTLLKHRLETVAFPAGITGIHFGLAQLCGEESKQNSLFLEGRVKQEERLKSVVKRLQARFGQNPLKKVAHVDPSSRIPERRSILTDYNP